MATDLQRFNRRVGHSLAAVILAAACGQTALAQVPATAVDQIGTLLQEKATRTSTQQKLGSQLWYALQASRGQTIDGVAAIYGSAVDRVAPDVSGSTKVTISGTVSGALLNQISALGGKVRYASTAAHSIQATVPLNALEALAANPDVQRIVPASRASTNVGALTSQGYISHKANQVVALGVNGTGVKVGVLSDSVDALPGLIATGDLPPDTVVVPGQDGIPGTSEGTAMMEIVHDLAPGAKLFFASAFNSPESFADNIRTLRNVYGCEIIVDDVSYSDEGVFQDSGIAQAVNDVTASGALYFSSAGNAGNLTSGNSSTWEGDFNAGSASGSPLPAGYTLHIFSGTQQFNRLAAASQVVDLQWSDPLGASNNDYDLFVLNSAGTSVLCASTDTQTGTQNPFEECFNNGGFPGNSRIVVAKKTERPSVHCTWTASSACRCRSARRAIPMATTPASTPFPRRQRTGTAPRRAPGHSSAARPIRPKRSVRMVRGRSSTMRQAQPSHPAMCCSAPTVERRWPSRTSRPPTARQPRHRASCRSSGRLRPRRTPRPWQRWSRRPGPTTPMLRF